MNGSWSFNSFFVFAAVNVSVAALVLVSANTVSPYDAVNKILSKRRTESAGKASQMASSLSEAGSVDWKDKGQGIARVSADLAMQVVLKKSKGAATEVRSSSVKAEVFPQSPADAPALPNGPSGTNNVVFEQFQASQGATR